MMHTKPVHRAAAVLSAVVGAALAAAPAAAAAPTTALAAGTWTIMSGTGECLVADHQNVYTINCSNIPASGQYWDLLPATNGSGTTVWRLKAAIGTCLSNFDFTRVWTTDCYGGDPGIWWQRDSAGRLKNDHTGRYLVADFAHQVYQNPTAGPEQWWIAY